jgi:hypothetical protein
MKVIGDRISVLKKEDLLSIVILPLTENSKLRVMLTWLGAWTICGIIVMFNFPSMKDQNSKLFVIVYLSFWAYYEYKITKAFLWRTYGKEKLWIKGGKLFYQKEIKGKGKVKEYDLELVSDLKVVEINEGNFFDFINKSFWVTGGERLELACQGKVMRFGMQLSDKEASSLFKDLSQFILGVLDKR